MRQWQYRAAIYIYNTSSIKNSLFFKRQIALKVHLQRVTFRGRKIVELHLVEKVMMPVEMQCPGPPVRLLCVLLILYSLYILPLIPTNWL